MMPTKPVSSEEQVLCVVSEPWLRQLWHLIISWDSVLEGDEKLAGFGQFRTSVVDLFWYQLRVYYPEVIWPKGKMVYLVVKKDWQVATLKPR